MDTYFNLTLKSTFMLKWLVQKNSKNSSSSIIGQQNSFILKVDDDVFVNPGVLKSVLDSELVVLAAAAANNDSASASASAGIEEKSSFDVTSATESHLLPKRYLILGRKLPERLGKLLYPLILMRS